MLRLRDAPMARWPRAGSELWYRGFWYRVVMPEGAMHRQITDAGGLTAVATWKKWTLHW